MDRKAQHSRVQTDMCRVVYDGTLDRASDSAAYEQHLSLSESRWGSMFAKDHRQRVITQDRSLQLWLASVTFACVFRIVAQPDFDEQSPRGTVNWHAVQEWVFTCGLCLRCCHYRRYTTALEAASTRPLACHKRSKPPYSAARLPSPRKVESA